MKPYLIDLAERAVRAFAAALLGVFTASETIATIHWPAALAAAGTAALVSVLLSLASLPISGKTTASLLPSPPAPGGGRHEAP